MAIFLSGLKVLFKVTLVIAVLVAVIIIVPGIPPNILFESHSLTPALKLEGVLAENNKLDKAEAIIDGGIVGPESVVVLKDGSVLTGVEGGDIIKYKDGKVSVVAKTGASCDKGVGKNACGRPLGLRVDSNGKLIVADAYYGLLSVDLNTGKVGSLFPYEEQIEGARPALADDLDISKDGTIYWSDASQFPIHDLLVDFLGNEPSGRLIKFDPSTKKNTVLVDKIHFANGVQLSQNEDFVLVCETMKARVLRYNLKGPKKGQMDIFLDGLPGLPDNVRSNGKDGFYISLVVARTWDFDAATKLPLLRKFILRTRSILLSVVSLVESLLPGNVYVVEVKEFVSLMGPIGKSHGKSILIEVNAKGEILSSLHSQTGKVNQICQMTLSPKGDYAYLSTPFGSKLWALKTSDL